MNSVSINNAQKKIIEIEFYAQIDKNGSATAWSVGSALAGLVDVQQCREVISELASKDQSLQMEWKLYNGNSARTWSRRSVSVPKLTQPSLQMYQSSNPVELKLGNVTVTVTGNASFSFEGNALIIRPK